MPLGDSFRYTFLGISLIGFVCCLDRSDYNVPLGIFAFILWSESHFPQKHRIMWVIIFSLLGDLIWIIAISIVEWNQEELE